MNHPDTWPYNREGPAPVAAAPTLPDTAEAWEREHAQGRIRKNAADLRRLADTYDRIADDLGTVPSPGRSSHVGVAGQIIHEHAVWTTET